MFSIDDLPLLLELLLVWSVFYIGVYLILSSDLFARWFDALLADDFEHCWGVKKVDPISRDWVVVERFVFVY